MRNISLIIAIMVFPCIRAEEWKCISEQSGIKSYLDQDVLIDRCECERVFIIKSKIVNANGAYDVATYYYRKMAKSWEAALVKDELFHRDGSVRSVRLIDSNQLHWIGLKDPIDKNLLYVLNKGENHIK